MNYQFNRLLRFVLLKPRFINACFFTFSLICFLAHANLNLTLAQTSRGGKEVSAKTSSNQKAALKPAVKTISKTKNLSKTAEINSSKQTLIVIGFNVYVRENSAANSKNIGQLKFGTIVQATERSKIQETIGEKQDFWHKISPTSESSKTGWVFGAFLKDFDQKKRETIYKQIITEKLKTANRSFDENVELYDFLTRAQSEVKTPAFLAEVSWQRLLILKNALELIPIDKSARSPYKEFTDLNSINIVYDEPGGRWLVRSDRFWSLSKRFAQLPLSETISWEAAQNPLPGECEGYLNCYLFAVRQTHGEYLDRFAKGAHAAEALKSVGEFLTQVVADADKKEFYNPPADVSDRAEFYKNISELRTIISRTGFFEKEAVLRQLDKIAESYR